MTCGRDLWRHLARTVALRPVLAALGGAALLALGGFRSPLEQTLAAMLVASGASGFLDDPAQPLVAASPSPLWWRRAMVLAIGLPLVLAVWVAVAGLADLLGPVGQPVATEVATMTVVVLGAAALALRRWSAGALAGPPVVLMIALSSLVLPDRWELYPVASHQWRWFMVLLVAASVLVGCSRDPAARSLLARRSRGPGWIRTIEG